jgi:polyphosphate kinase
MSDRYINRELSLLSFQERVLSLAENPALRLLERIKFVAIVSQNLDEFFQVRVAGLTNQAETGASPGPDRMTLREQLEAIRESVLSLNSRIDAVFLKELLPELERHGIRLVLWEDLADDDRAHLSRFFEEMIFPVLTPLAVDPSHPFPFISNLSLNLAVVLRGPGRAGLNFARVKVPPILDRFVVLPDGERFVALEKVIAAHLDRLFSGQEIIDYFAFRVTRSADFAVEEEEADDLLEAMETVLRFRQRAADAVRLEVGERMTPEVLALVIRELGLPESAVFVREAPLDLGGLWNLYSLDRPELKEEPWVPTTQHRLRAGPGKEIDFFKVLREGDVLVHYPYESFATSTGTFLAQAAADPDVLAIKQTLYRTSAPEDPAIGGEERIVRTLMGAAEAGKQVVVLIELKARFDEAANIEWAKMLENAGAHVAYGVSGLKTHSKILLVVRREAGELRRYAQIGTGNYNPKTARIYEDVGLFTADPDIGADLSELFNSLTGYNDARYYRRLLVAPATLRDRIVERIREEAAKGKAGRILFKLNHLVDPNIIDELYAASQEGCEIDLIVRGMCAIRAGVPGLSESIRVRSIVGRYLEHSRFYRFGPPGDRAVYYMGSADMMQRNLNGRVETLTPVVDPRLKARIEEVLEILLEDDDLAWEMTEGGESWARVVPTSGVNAHERLQALALERIVAP